MLGQAPEKVGPQLARCRRASRRRDHVGHQLVAMASARPRDHDRLPHGRVPAERGLDLGGLHPEAPHLALAVRPAGERDLAAGQVPAQVAGAVHAVVRPAGERTDEEPLAGQRGIA